MKGLIIYSSKYNTTKEYAGWISEKTGFDMISLTDLKLDQVRDKDMLIIGSPVMAHRPKLSRWIEKNWKSIMEKKIYLYTTSGTPSNDPGLTKGFHASLPEELHKGISYFPMSGRMIYSKLSRMDKLFMKIGQMMEKDPEVKKKMIMDVDGVDKKEIKSLVSDINQYLGNN